jgi:hypothetical protein
VLRVWIVEAAGQCVDRAGCARQLLLGEKGSGGHGNRVAVGSRAGADAAVSLRAPRAYPNLVLWLLLLVLLHLLLPPWPPLQHTLLTAQARHGSPVAQPIGGAPSLPSRSGSNFFLNKNIGASKNTYSNKEGRFLFVEG